MHGIATPRGGGKTTRLVEWQKGGKEQGKRRVILTATEADAEWLRREHGLVRSAAMSVERARTTLLAGQDVEIAVDNVDIVLRGLLRLQQTPKVVTFTGDTE